MFINVYYVVCAPHNNSCRLEIVYVRISIIIIIIIMVYIITINSSCGNRLTHTHVKLLLLLLLLLYIGLSTHTHTHTRRRRVTTHFIVVYLYDNNIIRSYSDFSHPTAKMHNKASCLVHRRQLVFPTQHALTIPAVAVYTTGGVYCTRVPNPTSCL